MIYSQSKLEIDVHIARLQIKCVKVVRIYKDVYNNDAYENLYCMLLKIDRPNLKQEYFRKRHLDWGLSDSLKTSLVYYES